MLGMRFGDPGSAEATKFLLDASRRTGYVATGAEDAMDHLEQKQGELEGVVRWGASLGLNPRSNDLIENSKAAATHIIKEAVGGGFKPQSHDPQANLAGAMAWLGENGPDSQQNPLKDLEKLMGGKINPWMLAGGLLALNWLGGR
jgi:hypothetical protein